MTVRSDQFMMALLKWKNYPISNNNIRTMVIWKVSEGSNAIWNPFDTEWPMPGATNYNKVGVKNYASITDGITAFWNTLDQPEWASSYGPIKAALMASEAPAIACQTIANSVWGSKPSSSEIQEVLSNFEHYASMPIAGSGTVVLPTQDNTPDPAPSGVIPPTLNKNRSETVPIVINEGTGNAKLVSMVIGANGDVQEVSRDLAAVGEEATAQNTSIIDITAQFGPQYKGATVA